MIILGIETSCDDTGVAILEIKGSRFKILSNIVSSQVKLHAKYGGVYPVLAKREHRKNLPILLKKALKEAKNPRVDIIAVTTGPGLEPCLWEGVNFAKELAKGVVEVRQVRLRRTKVNEAQPNFHYPPKKLKAPLVPVNHMEGHIIANFVGKIQNTKYFPAIALAVSGGHTQLYLMRGVGKYKLIGETKDDAAGECFDKTARILELPYPGGPAIAAAAARNKKQEIRNKISLPRPMIHQKNYDFSFSGLKTAVLYKVKDYGLQIKDKKVVQAMAAEIQQAIIDVLIHKTMRAAKEHKAKSIILGGGVASNEELRRQFKYKIQDTKYKIQFLAPPKNLCTDNGAMIAAAGYFKWARSKTRVWKDIKADANLRL